MPHNAALLGDFMNAANNYDDATKALLTAHAQVRAAAGRLSCTVFDEQMAARFNGVPSAVDLALRSYTQSTVVPAEKAA